MSFKDKLEIGLKPDAPYREDNLPDIQKDDPACQDGAAPDNAPETEDARAVCDTGGTDVPKKRKRRRA
jgi:hypothetical protein